jgi:K+ transporter
MAGRLLSRWRTQIFILMSNNALDATEFFRIPPNGVAESGPERPVVRQRRGV